MEKHFVTYEQALDLKDLGFKESCFGEWRQWDGGYPWLQLYQDLDGCLTDDSDYQYTNEASAPLKSQVFEWARAEYDLYHIVHHFEHNKNTTKEFLSEVTGKLLMGNDDISGFSYHSTYNDGELACIDILIEIIKNK